MSDASPTGRDAAPDTQPDRRGSAIVATIVDLLFPLWQWLVLVPVMVVATVVAAPIAIVASLFGAQRFANLHVAARWARLIAYLTPMRIEIEGREHLEEHDRVVVVANHQSQYDIPLIYGFIGLDLRWVMKAELRKIPLVAQGCRAIGHIFIDRGNPDQAREAINEAVARLPDGTGVLFFPEGTRSRSGELLKFRKGAFRVAADRGIPVLPVTVTGTRDLLRPGSLRIRPGRARMIIHPPVEPPDERSVEVRTRWLSRRARACIQHGLEHGSPAPRSDDAD